MALRVLGVPSAAGAYGNGVALAPRALREARLLEGLSERGVEVADSGDLPLVPFTPDPANPKQQNIQKVIEVASEVAGHVAAISMAGDVPLVLGGNCSLTLGVIAGLCSRHPDLGLAYFDGDVDMSMPARTVSGVVDAMGIATMLGLEGASEAFAAIGPRVPLMDGHRIAIIGYDEAELDAGPRDLLLQRGVHLIDGSAVRGRPAAAAADALDALEHRDGLIVHTSTRASRWPMPSRFLRCSRACRTSSPSSSRRSIRTTIPRISTLFGSSRASSMRSGRRTRWQVRRVRRC